MPKMKFELFITSENVQTTLEVSDRPIFIGFGSNCEVKVKEDGGSKIKAIIQKEDDALVIKIYDNKFPIDISNKKYKSAKIKKSMFFKIGPVDIIASLELVEEKEEIVQPVSEGLPDELPDYVDDVPEVPVSKPTVLEVPKAVPSLPQVSVEMAVEEQSADSDDVSKLLATSPVVSTHLNKSVEPSESNDDYDSFFKFNITFDEDHFEKKSHTNYEDKNFDYSGYIDLEDETENKVPTPEILVEKDGDSVHVTHMNNGIVLGEKYFPMSAKRIFVSNQHESSTFMKIHDCGVDRNELFYSKDGRIFVVRLDDFAAYKMLGDKFIEVDRKTIELDQKIIFIKGLTQIIIEPAKMPPGMKKKGFFDVDDQLIKYLVCCWLFTLVPILSVLIHETPKEEAKKEMVIIYKRKKIEIEETKPTPQSQDVAKAEVKNDKPKQVEKKIEKKVEKKIVEKKMIKKPEKVVKKKVQKPVKKVVKKIVKDTKPAKKATKSKKVTKKIAKKKAPKKQFKFNFGSKMKSMVAESSGTQLKSAQSSASVNVASEISSSTSLSKNFNSSKIGRTKTEIGRFAAGNPKGSSKAIGTKGLSGKSKAATAYIEANTKILGALDPDLIRKIMREYIPQFRHCYQRELLTNPSVAGVFDLAFQINGRGKGINVAVKSNGKGFSSKGKGCLKRVVKLIPFPRPKGGGLVDVKQPMNFYKQ